MRPRNGCWLVGRTCKGGWPPVSVTRKWKKMVSKLRRRWSPRLSWTITANMMKRMRLEEQWRAKQGQEAERAQNISRKWRVLFETPL